MGREDALEQARDIVAADRLRQVVERAQAHGGDRITATGIGGQYHDGYRRESMDAPQLSSTAIPSMSGSRMSRNMQAGCRPRSMRASACSPCRRIGFVTEIGQRFRQSFAEGIVVVDQQDGRHGISMTKQVVGVAA